MNSDRILGISPEVRALADRAMADIAPYFTRIDAIAEVNSAKVMKAFADCHVDEGCFAGTTGYGYDDKGREVLDQVYAQIFGAEAALVRLGFVNGTHAITASLFACVRPGDVLMSATGLPYDTIQGVIGITGDYHGSLKFYGIEYKQVDLTKDGKPDYEAIRRGAADPRVKAVAVQRSRGYSSRDTLSTEEMQKICAIVHEVNPNANVVVDNCYGEFTDILEPTDVGADLMAGSLMKNPGGGLAPMGGYVVGKKDLVEKAAMHQTTPGIGGECGATLGQNRLLFQGLFMAPHVVAQAVKTAVFCARMMELMGYTTLPASSASRYDTIQMVSLGSEEGMKKYCKGIQSASPVDGYVTPEPAPMPGYEDQVIMAAGAFIQGSTMELSADGPVRPPYSVYQQGGLTFESGKLAVMLAAQKLTEKEK